MNRYILAPPAREDLIAIRDYSRNGQSKNRSANAGRVRERVPNDCTDTRIGHKREDLAEDRTVLFWPLREYLIVYRVKTQLVEIITVVHGRRDVAQLLKHRDP